MSIIAIAAVGILAVSQLFSLITLIAADLFRGAFLWACFLNLLIGTLLLPVYIKIIKRYKELRSAFGDVSAHDMYLFQNSAAYTTRISNEKKKA